MNRLVSVLYPIGTTWPTGTILLRSQTRVYARGIWGGDVDTYRSGLSSQRHAGHDIWI